MTSSMWINQRIKRLAPRIIISGLIIFILLSTGLAGAQPSGDQRFGLANASEAAQAAYDSGAGWETMPFKWSELQPNSASEWNVDSGVDEWLNSARGIGREVVGVLYVTPAWATEGNPGTGVPTGLYLPVSAPGNVWAGYVRQVVGYYAARGINRWVIWKGMDIPAGVAGHQWDGNTEDYYQLVKIAYLAAKEANPNALIHLGGVGSHDPTWFSRFMDVAVKDITAAANDYYFDATTVHAFGSPESVFTQTGNHFFVLDQRGVPLKEVWINELNARPAVDPEVYTGDTNFREYPAITLEQQAAYIVQAHALGFAANRFARIGVYRLVDDLEEDNEQAFGLIREDGSQRPAYTAYQIMVREFSGFVFARRVDEETFPLVDYVRLTFPNKVTHVAWAVTDEAATLVIPARSSEARLLDIEGNTWIVQPEGGEYRVAVGGADCNDPFEGCLIGGMPWMLVEEGLTDPLNETAPAVSVERGGVLPTPDPSMIATETALAQPTATATPLPTETPLPTATAASTETIAATVTSVADEAAEATVEEVVVEPTTAQPEETEVAEAAEAGGEPEAEVVEIPPEEEIVVIDPSVLQPQGFDAFLPYGLIGAGGLAIVAGVLFFMGVFPRGKREMIEEVDEEALEDDDLAPEEIEDEYEYDEDESETGDSLEEKDTEE